jgi:hypothetical protein
VLIDPAERWYADNNGVQIRVRSTGNLVCEMPDEARARLIRAAPELLSKLCELELFCRVLGHDNPRAAAVADSARKTIADAWWPQAATDHTSTATNGTA